MNVTQEFTQSFVKGCLRGEDPECRKVCPFGLDVKDFLAKTAKEKWSAAYKTYRNAVVFPGVVAALCPEPCKSACVLNNAPILINAVENEVLANVKKRGADFYAVPPKDKRVAVVGAGAAGLACALGLANHQFKVTVFDGAEGWGGSLRAHQNFDQFNADFNDQFVAVKVEFVFGHSGEISDSDYDAVYRAPDRGNAIEEIVLGKQAATDIEIYLQTGKYPERAPVNVPGEPSVVKDVINAALEASRCIQCDCNKCGEACSMLRNFKKDPHRIALEFFADSHVNPPLSTHSLGREAYSCNNCGACKEVCPKGIDLGELFSSYRRMRAENGTVPTAFHDIFLRRAEEFNAAGRIIMPKDGSDYLFFPGCSVAVELPGTTEKLYTYLRERYGVGLLERCCGSPSMWAGEGGDQFDLSGEVDGKTIIYACPSCHETLSNQYPNLKLVSVYELIEPSDISGEYALFHACASRSNTPLRQTVEKLCTDSKLAVSKSALRCCGYGGQTLLANPDNYDQWSTDSANLSGLPYIVYCGNCRETFKRKNKEVYHILELLFPSDGNRAAHNENLIISDEARAFMNSHLMSEADVWEVISHAENSSDKFESPDGTILASLVKNILTYWVEYKPLGGDKFEVVNAYYHRMKFRQEGSANV
ncbi:MAG: NAD(P)-binding protein [Oscillospiraceae bacterium]|jgi:Fe-S oxidoreductase|nr:NAD(P)-binding protein [Oscillospiraceae bacterium]